MASAAIGAYVLRVDLEPEWNRVEVSALSADGVGENCV